MLDIESFFLCAGVPFREKARESVKKSSLRFESFLLIISLREDRGIMYCFDVCEYELAALYRFYRRVLFPMEMEMSHIGYLLWRYGVYLSASQIEYIMENELSEYDISRAIGARDVRLLRQYGLTDRQVGRIRGDFRIIEADIGA